MDFATFISEKFVQFNDILWSVWVLIPLLLIIGLYFTFKTKFVQIRYLKEMILLLGENNTNDKNYGKKVSSFQAFCVSTASRVGTGNLAGVAIAVATGGPGAVFWMWIIALIGSSSSFIESTLAQVYKQSDGKGSFIGGPAYYMEKALGKRWMGVIFSILIIVAFGLAFNSVQSNTISEAFYESFGIPTQLMGIILTIVTAFIIFGGIQRIAKISGILVPVMSLFYIGLSLFILITNISKLPSVISLIVQSAFGVKQILGGTIGSALLNGIKRGLFSNEAGMGSSPNAAATATVSHPVKQGLIQTLGVFTDTILICSCTAFILLLSSNFEEIASNYTGINLTQQALIDHVGSWGGIFISICILLFAFSSIIGNYYYGEANIEFLTKNKICMLVYRIAVLAMVFIGSVAELDFVWNFADISMGLMAIVNLIAIVMLSKIAFKVLQDYDKQRKNGIKNPVFKSSSIEGLNNADEWK